VIPRSTLDQLGISPYAEETFHLADGSEIRSLMGDVFIRIDGKARTVPTIFGEPTDTPLLGVTALEILGYAIDPSTRKLEPTKMLLLHATSILTLGARLRTSSDRSLSPNALAAASISVRSRFPLVPPG
jgi:hypothetical protein